MAALSWLHWRPGLHSFGRTEGQGCTHLAALKAMAELTWLHWRIWLNSLCCTEGHGCTHLAALKAMAALTWLHWRQGLRVGLASQEVATSAVATTAGCCHRYCQQLALPQLPRHQDWTETAVVGRRRRTEPAKLNTFRPSPWYSSRIMDPGFRYFGFDPRAPSLHQAQKPFRYHGLSGVVETNALYHKLGEKNSPSLYSRLGRWTAPTVQKNTNNNFEVRMTS